MVTKIYKNAISSFVTGEVMINHGTFEVTEISPSKDFSACHEAEGRCQSKRLPYLTSNPTEMASKAEGWWVLDKFLGKVETHRLGVERFYLFRIMSGDGIPSSPPGRRSLARETFGKVRTDRYNVSCCHVARFNECPKICAPVAWHTCCMYSGDKSCRNLLNLEARVTF